MCHGLLCLGEYWLWGLGKHLEDPSSVLFSNWIGTDRWTALCGNVCHAAISWTVLHSCSKQGHTGYYL